MARHHQFHRLIAIAAAATAIIAGPTIAQTAVPGDASNAGAPDPYAPAWSSPEIEAFANAIIGTWATTEAVAELDEQGGSDASSNIVLQIAAAPVAGMTDTLYVESSRADRQFDPFRHSIFQIFEYKGGLRLRTYEITVGTVGTGAFNGMWAAPEYFPTISRSDLIATIDLDITGSGSDFQGKSPYLYPTGVGGAVEMSSSMTLSAKALTTSDTGFAADGSVAWGSGNDASYSFVRSINSPRVTKFDNGLVIVEYLHPEGAEVADRESLHVHYSGYLQSAKLFDSSYNRGQPFKFVFPPRQRAIEGWGIGMEGVTLNTRRRLIVPSHLGYKERGNERAGIPGNSTLYFDIHIAHIERLNTEAGPDTDPAGAGG